VDLIERLFHISPDGGNGTLELLVFVVLLLIPIAVGWLVRSRSA
jgi:hypothetical protein